MRAVGVDLSLQSTGVARDDGTHVIKPTAGLTGAERLIFIRDRVLEMCEGADVVAVEEFALGQNGKAHAEITGVGWVVRVALTDAKVTWVSIPIQTLKIYATGKGNAQKIEMIREAERKIDGLILNTSDEADAFLLRAMALHHYTGSPVVNLPATQTKALARVAWRKLECVA